MDLKNFLKPTQEKIIIVCLIFVFTIFFRGLVTETEIKILTILERILSPHYFIYETISLFYGDYWSLFAVFLGVLAFVDGLLYWYLLASFIVFLYDRIKRGSTK